jgi:hypothetical protein
MARLINDPTLETLYNTSGITIIYILKYNKIENI